MCSFNKVIYQTFDKMERGITTFTNILKKLECENVMS